MKGWRGVLANRAINLVLEARISTWITEWGRRSHFHCDSHKTIRPKLLWLRVGTKSGVPAESGLALTHSLSIRNSEDRSVVMTWTPMITMEESIHLGRYSRSYALHMYYTMCLPKYFSSQRENASREKKANTITEEKLIPWRKSLSCSRRMEKSFFYLGRRGRGKNWDCHAFFPSDAIMTFGNQLAANFIVVETLSWGICLDVLEEMKTLHRRVQSSNTYQLDEGSTYPRRA